MFEGFASVWTPVEPARALKRRKPLATTLAGEKLVLFRDGEGRPAALIDRCPHRGVALSLGRVTEDGCLECPFHGWQFKPDGSCSTIPLNDIAAAKRERFGSIALPTREAGGLIWVFTGLDAKGTEPAVPEALLERNWSRWTVAPTWSTHWTRAMENMLDSPHVPFLHRRTIGRGLRRDLKPTSVMNIDTEPTDTGFVINYGVENHQFKAGLEFRRPNGMVLYLSRKKPGFRQHLFCIPVDATHVRMLLVSTRQFLRYNPLGWLGDQFNRIVLREDKAVVESSQPAEVPPPGDEVSVPTDAPTLAFRKYYYRELHPSGAATLVDASRLAAGK
ncbi:MAG: aromatic ring-hydroxylating dioxygenase subunit alpha [Deltaproteobacteria bacterium]